MMPYKAYGTPGWLDAMNAGGTLYSNYAVWSMQGMHA